MSASSMKFDSGTIIKSHHNQKHVTTKSNHMVAQQQQQQQQQHQQQQQQHQQQQQQQQKTTSYCEDNDDILSQQNKVNHMRQAAVMVAANRQQQLVKQQHQNQQNGNMKLVHHQKLLTLSPVQPGTDSNSSHSDDSGVHSPNQIRHPPTNGHQQQQQHQLFAASGTTTTTTTAALGSNNQNTHSQSNRQQAIGATSQTHTISQQHRLMQQQQQHQQQQSQLSEARSKSGLVMRTSSQANSLLLLAAAKHQHHSNGDQPSTTRLSAAERLGVTAKRPIVLGLTSTIAPQPTEHLSTTTSNSLKHQQQLMGGRNNATTSKQVTHPIGTTKSAPVLPTLKTLLQQQQQLKQQQQQQHSQSKQSDVVFNSRSASTGHQAHSSADNLTTYDRALPETPPGGSSEESDESSPMSSLQSCDSPPPPILLPPPPPSLLKPEHQQSLNDLRSANANLNQPPSQGILVTAHPAVASPDGVPDLRNLGVADHQRHHQSATSQTDLVITSSRRDNGHQHHIQSNNLTTTIGSAVAKISQKHPTIAVDAQNNLHNNHNDDHHLPYPPPPPILPSDMDTCQDYHEQLTPASLNYHRTATTSTTISTSTNDQVYDGQVVSDTIKSAHRQPDRTAIFGLEQQQKVRHQQPTVDNFKTTKLINSQQQQQQQQQRQQPTIESSPSQQQPVITSQQKQQKQCQHHSDLTTTIDSRQKQQANNNGQLLTRHHHHQQQQQHINESDMQMKLSGHQAHRASLTVTTATSTVVGKRQQLFAAPADFRTSGPVKNQKTIINKNETTTTTDSVDHGFVQSPQTLLSAQKASSRAADVSMATIMTKSIQSNRTSLDQQPGQTGQSGQANQVGQQQHPGLNQQVNQSQAYHHSNVINSNKLPPAVNLLTAPTQQQQKQQQQQQQQQEQQQVPPRMSARDRLSISSTASSTQSTSSLSAIKCPQQQQPPQTLGKPSIAGASRMDPSRHIDSLTGAMSGLQQQQQQQRHPLMATSQGNLAKNMTTQATATGPMLMNVTNGGRNKQEMPNGVQNHQPMTTSVVNGGYNGSCINDQHNMSRRNTQAAASDAKQAPMIKQQPQQQQNGHQQKQMAHHNSPLLSATTAHPPGSVGGSGETLNADGKSYTHCHGPAIGQTPNYIGGNELKQSSNSNLHLIRPPPLQQQQQQQPSQQVAAEPTKQPLLGNASSPPAAAKTTIRPQEKHYQSEESLEQINALSLQPHHKQESRPGGQYSKQMHMTGASASAKTEQLYKQQHQQQLQRQQNGHSAMPPTLMGQSRQVASTDISVISSRSNQNSNASLQQQQVNRCSLDVVDRVARNSAVATPNATQPGWIQATSKLPATMADNVMATTTTTADVQHSAGQLHDVIDKRHHDETNQLARSDGNFLSQAHQNHLSTKLQQHHHHVASKFAPMPNGIICGGGGGCGGDGSRNGKTNHGALEGTINFRMTSGSQTTIKDQMGFPLQDSTRSRMPNQINHHSAVQQQKSCTNSSAVAQNSNHHHRCSASAGYNSSEVSLNIRSSLPPPPPLPEKRSVLKQRPTNTDDTIMVEAPPPPLPHRSSQLFATNDTMHKGDLVNHHQQHHLNLNSNAASAATTNSNNNMDEYINLANEFNQLQKRDYTGSATMIDQQAHQHFGQHENPNPNPNVDQHQAATTNNENNISNNNNSTDSDNNYDHVAHYDEADTDLATSGGFDSIQSNGSDESFRFPTPPPPLMMINQAPVHSMTSSQVVYPNRTATTANANFNANEKSTTTTSNCGGAINSNQFSSSGSGQLKNHHGANHTRANTSNMELQQQHHQINHQVAASEQQLISGQSSQRCQPMMNVAGDYSGQNGGHQSYQSQQAGLLQSSAIQTVVSRGQATNSNYANDQLAYDQQHQRSLASGQQRALEQAGMLSSLNQSSNLARPHLQHQSTGNQHLSCTSGGGGGGGVGQTSTLAGLPPPIMESNAASATNGVDVVDFGVAAGSQATSAIDRSHLNHLPMHHYSPVPPVPLPPGSTSPSSSSDGGASTTGSSSSTSGVHSSASEDGQQMQSIQSYRTMASQMPSLKMLQQRGLCANADTNSVSSLSSEQSFQSTNSSRDEKMSNRASSLIHNQSQPQQQQQQQQQQVAYTKSEFRARHHYHSSGDTGDNDGDELGVDENVDMNEFDETMMIKAMMRMLSQKMLSRQQEQQQTARKSILSSQDMSKLRQKVKQMQQKQQQQVNSNNNNNNNNNSNSNSNSNNSLLSPALINKLKMMINGDDIDDFEDDDLGHDDVGDDDEDDDQRSTSTTQDTEESEDSATAGHKGNGRRSSANNRLVSKANVDKKLVKCNGGNSNNNDSSMYYQQVASKVLNETTGQNRTGMNGTIKAKSIISSNKSNLSSSMGNKKKSVSFSDKIELVACADEQVEEFLPNPLLDRILKQAKSQQQQQQQQQHQQQRPV